MPIENVQPIEDYSLIREGTNLLKEANCEIQSLRKINELMAARLDMFDQMMSVLNANVATKSEGMSPDVGYAINVYLRKIENTLFKPLGVQATDK